MTDVPQSARPLYEVIYDVLRDHLVAGRFPAGLVLGEANVARAFATSRIPAAAALRRLRDDGLVSDFEGRGYLAGRDPQATPLRAPLEDAGLELPDNLRPGLELRTRAARLYPIVEHAVASCLAYGKFLLNESLLAEHFGVSRAVAHEVLTRLERTGIVAQDTNQRWYAGPMTAALVHDHFEMRWLLEPVALRQAAPKIPREELIRKRDHVVQLSGGLDHPERLERVEQELHIELIERCGNEQLVFAVRRSQLPLIATHSTYGHYQDAEEIVRMAGEHRSVYDALLAADIDTAAAALEAHLKRSVAHNIEVLKQLPSLDEANRPPYLLPA